VRKLHDGVPTCFCTSVEEVSDLAGMEVERVRLWESCFTVDHSFLHGGSVRRSGRSRYRQWLTHKFGTGRTSSTAPAASDAAAASPGARLGSM